VNDYNTVAVLILKCTIEYPQKFTSTNSNSSKKEYDRKNQRKKMEGERKNIR